MTEHSDIQSAAGGSIYNLQFRWVVMKKFALFVFNGDPMCFIHVLLNAHDMSDKGYGVKIITF